MKNFNFCGMKKKKNYFEGWYFKISDNENNCYSFIFGITLNEEDPHSFIQIIDQRQNKVYYFKYKVSDFSHTDNLISIGNNVLSCNCLKLLVYPFDIDVTINPTTYLKRRFFGRSVMSYLKYLPLPTKHEIVYMKAKVKGIIKNMNNRFDFCGSGYMEKDYGTAFPKRWLWIQTNQFTHNDISLVISKADLLGRISGFFCFLNINGKEYRFATYNGAKIKKKRVKDGINFIIKKDEYTLKIRLKKEKGNMIIAPVHKAKMAKKIEESLNSKLFLFLYKNNKLIKKDSSFVVACEYLY